MKKLSSTYQNTPMYFADAAADYLEWIKKDHPEHFMESVAQADQRAITVFGLSRIAAKRPDVFVYSELLIQWRDDKMKLRRVVPDNMVVIADKKPTVSTNFAIPVQPARPYFVLEYVSKTNSRKDYQKSYDKYEQELKVPYYLLFCPEAQELTLFKLNKRKGKYAGVLPDDAGYSAIPELDLTMRILDGWTRFWWKGELLPIPDDWEATIARSEEKIEGLSRAKADLTRANEDQARLIADMQAELERLRKSAG